MTTINQEDVAQQVQRYQEAEHRGDLTIWERADIALYVHDTYGDIVLKMVADQTGERLSTLRTYKWVAEAYQPVTRQVAVSFSHYKAAAKLEERFVFLQKAFEGKWSVSKMEEEIVAAGASSRIKIPRKRKGNQIETQVGQPIAEEKDAVLETQTPAQAITQDPGGLILPANAVTPEEMAAVLNWGYANEQEKFQGMTYTAFLNYAISRVGKLVFDQTENVFKVVAVE